MGSKNQANSKFIEFKKGLLTRCEELLSKRYKLYKCFYRSEIKDIVSEVSRSLEGSRVFDLYCKDQATEEDWTRLADLSAYRLYNWYYQD